AKLAGIPDDVIIRAFEILEQIDEKDPFKTTVRENGEKLSSPKYYDKLINEKKVELDKLNEELKTIKESLSECIEDLSKNQKELEKKQNEIKYLEVKRVKVLESKTLKNKKYIQTSLFEPINNKEQVMDILNFMKEFDINSIIPAKLKEKLKELTKKIEKLS
ncbi:MAG: hypothetical protein ACFFDG_14035, partial [Promethearchaeota archaeon]